MHALYSILAIITDYWPVYAGVPNKVDIYLYVSIPLLSLSPLCDELLVVHMLLAVQHEV